jgi:hypothetical protein
MIRKGASDFASDDNQINGYGVEGEGGLLITFYVIFLKLNSNGYTYTREIEREVMM